MPRLIDADDIWYDLLENTGNKEHPLEWAVSQSRIDRMPTIDAVKVVRCQDCIYSKEYEDNGIWCERLTGVFRVDHDGFCKWGDERR